MSKRTPSELEMQRAVSTHEMRLHESSLVARARRFGVSDDASDIWALTERVHRAEDESKRWLLEERAGKLGVPTHNRFLWWRWPRDYRSLWWDCHMEESRRELEAKYRALPGESKEAR